MTHHCSLNEDESKPTVEAAATTVDEKSDVVEVFSSTDAQGLPEKAQKKLEEKSTSL